MDFKDFIIGEKYNISALAIEGSFAAKKYAVFKLPTGRTFLLRAEDFEAVSPENGTKNTETAPKYDPNRRFRKGDIVTPKERNGRIPWAKDMTLTVVADESTAGVTVRCDDTGEERLMCVLFLELITTVEELEPYYTIEAKEWIDGDSVKFWAVRDEHSDTVAKFYVELYRADGAQKAAESERDRRNAEWRKEQK